MGASELTALPPRVLVAFLQALGELILNSQVWQICIKKTENPSSSMYVLVKAAYTQGSFHLKHPKQKDKLNVPTIPVIQSTAFKNYTRLAQM